jgi:citrate lyase beta subunit
METTLAALDGLDGSDGLFAAFEETHREQLALYAPREPGWQPLHTVYVPADKVTAAIVAEWRHAAVELLHKHVFAPGDLASLFDLDIDLATPVHDRLRKKLASEPIEDLRIDFEDGYGFRPWDEEDRHAEAAAAAVLTMHEEGCLPRRWGLRIKSFADGDPRRSIRTLDGFLTRVIKGAGELPRGFTVTFPKVLMEDYLRQFVRCLEALEGPLRLVPGTLRFEMQVEAPQTVLFLQRSAGLVPSLGGRLAAAHFGVFDYTAAIGLPPQEQRLDHPACDHARHVMQTALAGTGVELSDGSLAAAPTSDTADDVRDLLRRHAAQVRHSFSHGYYQGWDMHPSHLVSRFAIAYAFHLKCYEAYAERVRAWEDERAAEGGILDEPATIRTLIAALARADHALS